MKESRKKRERGKGEKKERNLCEPAFSFFIPLLSLFFLLYLPV
jgi:hypothetical protein